MEQASAIPFRRTGEGIEYLLVTSTKGHWIFPKGIVESGDTPEATAEKETREEAGIEGAVVGGPIGNYRDAKWGLEITVRVYLLEFRREVAWAERGSRRRRWCSLDEARSRLSKGKLRKLLERAAELLENGEMLRDP